MNKTPKLFLILFIFVFGLALVWHNSNWQTALGVFLVAGSYNAAR